MAGSIGLSLQQQIDINTGGLLVGGRLLFYQAGTVGTPQNAFKDTALTQAYPNPIILGSDARIPPFYVADGLIRVRLEDKAGNKQFDWDSVLVIGASGGGGGGGGGTVDPTALFQTGDPIWLPIQGTRIGWVRMNRLTVGSSTSGATERANADTQNLFTYLWNSYADAVCPVSGGRGASAVADWAANKTIGIPDMRGRGPTGLDDMGNTSASLLTGALFTLGTPTTAAAAGGEALHTLIAAEVPVITPTATLGVPSASFAGNAVTPTFTGNAVTPSGSISNGSTSTSWLTNGGSNTAGSLTGGTSIGTGIATFTGNAFTPSGSISQITPSGSISVTGGSVSVNPIGGGQNHNNMPPFRLGTYFMKL